ncbi:MAG: prepilin peptidase [Archangium sp.]|nr:prepilin peptidase [Archangium sp.]
MQLPVGLESLSAAFLFGLGLLFGSFLNVVIHRLPRAESETSTWWVGYSSLWTPPRSACPHCGHAIRWYENIPVFSWLALRGRCAGCKAPISARYVLVELMTGLLFAACFVRFGLTYPLLPALVMMVLVVPLVFIDAEHWILPFELTLPGIVLGISLSVPMGWETIANSLIGAGAAFLAFRLMEYFGWLLFRKEALGAGDKYLLALLGAFLGWRPLFAVLFLSSLQGAVFGGLNLLLRGRAGPEREPEKTELPAPPTAEQTPPADPTAPSVEEEEEEVFTFTPDFLKPGLSVARRLVLLPWTMLFQPIPDDPVVDETAEGDAAEEVEWTPGVTSLPFGPWIGLAGIEVLLLTPWLHATFAGTPFGMTLKLLFGPPS